jgi:hypothetical protein
MIVQNTLEKPTLSNHHDSVISVDRLPITVIKSMRAKTTQSSLFCLKSIKPPIKYVIPENQG